jgi:hypothetical protein
VSGYPPVQFVHGGLADDHGRSCPP